MMTKYKVIYSPTASEDVEDIYSYIAYKLKEKQTAKKLVKRIYKSVRSLCNYPERFKRVEREPWASMGVRQLPEGNYMIYYLPDIQRLTVTVFRIAYGGRDLKNVIDSE